MSNDAATDCSLCVHLINPRRNLPKYYRFINTLSFANRVKCHFYRRLIFRSIYIYIYIYIYIHTCICIYIYMYTCRARIVQIIVKFCISVVVPLTFVNGKHAAAAISPIRQHYDIAYNFIFTNIIHIYIYIYMFFTHVNIYAYYHIYICVYIEQRNYKIYFSFIIIYFTDVIVYYQFEKFAITP